MRNVIFRTLRGQMLLLAGLFTVCLLAAVVMASQRARFEQFAAERYQPLPARLQPLADAAATGDLDQKVFVTLSPADRLALYDAWMTHDEPLPTGMPSALVAADPALYVSRAERSLVTGRLQQKLRAVAFLELAGSLEALPILRKAARWASRHQWPELDSHIATAVRKIETLSQE